MGSKSIAKRRRGKTKIDRPAKPYAEFPLYAHNLGYWSKKIQKRILHFGRWARVVNGKLEPIPYEEGWQAALASFKARVDDAQAKRIRESVVKPKAESDDLTVKELCNRFLNAKRRKMESGELSKRSHDEYCEMAERMSASLGKDTLVENLTADDFESLRADAAKIWGPLRLGKYVQCVRTMFKYALESGLVDRPVRFGPEFTRPTADVLRKHRAARGKRLFTAQEIRELLDGRTETGDDGTEQTLAGASPQVRAMILLALNCGFGNSDVSELSKSIVDLETGWIDYPRPKTGIERRCPLWPETIEALRVALADCPDAKEKADADCVFVTRQGNRWVRGTINSVGLEFGKLLRRLGINGRIGLGFYSLRHTFRTVSDATKDFPAVRLIMGHADGSIDAVYREQIDDDRLQAVVAHVRTWLFG